MMHRTALNNEVMIPQIGFGVFQLDNGKDTEDAVSTALETGYRLLDTATVYGNEESVGAAVASSGIARNELFITTKAWNTDIRKGRVKDALRKSLDDLKMDYVDLYLIHWPVEGWQRAWEDMQSLYEDGLVRAIGVSNFERENMEAVLSMGGVVPAVDQFESSPQFQNTDLVRFCQSKGVVVEAYQPLGGQDSAAKVLDNPVLIEIGTKYGKSPAQAALRWQIQRDVIPLPRSRHAARIEQNFDVFDFELSPEDMKAIDAIGTGVRNGADPSHIDF